jgi:hypothetical protein
VYVQVSSISRLGLTSGQDKGQEATRVKRERQEERGGSEATLVADDEVEWVGTQPAERCAKRVRRGPGVGDEVVGLDD